MVFWRKGQGYKIQIQLKFTKHLRYARNIHIQFLILILIGLELGIVITTDSLEIDAQRSDLPEIIQVRSDRDKIANKSFSFCNDLAAHYTTEVRYFYFVCFNWGKVFMQTISIVLLWSQI